MSSEAEWAAPPPDNGYGPILHDDFNMVGVTTTPGAAQTYAVMKGGPVLRLVVDRDWVASHDVRHEIGGSGKDQLLFDAEEIPKSALLSASRWNFE